METPPQHPLEHAWDFYLHFPLYGHTATELFYSSQAYHQLCTFYTVEDFWDCFEDQIEKPSEIFFTSMSPRVQIHNKNVEAFDLFKHGIRPEWEDPMNVRGGHWECRRSWTPEELDNVWLELVMALVGEVLEEGRVIAGARLVDKSRPPKDEYRIEVWTTTCDVDKNETIRQRLVSILGPLSFVWKSHGESIEACHSQAALT